MMTMLLKSILIFIFVVISISDWRTHKIPDRWNAGILLVGSEMCIRDRYPASGRKKKRAKDSIRLRPVFMYGYDSSHGVWRRMGCVVFIRID